MAMLSLAGLLPRMGAWVSTACATIAGIVTRYPWQALVVALALTLGVAEWRVDRLGATVKGAQADRAQAETALKVEQASNARLLASLARQTAATAQLGKDSTAAVAQGNQADADAVERSKTRADQASKIIIPPPAPVQPDCRTPDSVMAAKGNL